MSFGDASDPRPRRRVRLLRRLQGRYRELVHALEPALRLAKREAALLRFRLRQQLGAESGLRVVCALVPVPTRRVPHPAITVLPAARQNRAGATASAEEGPADEGGSSETASSDSRSGRAEPAETGASGRAGGETAGRAGAGGAVGADGVVAPEANGQVETRLAGFLGGQTERSLTSAPCGRYLFLSDGELGSLAATHLESMLMAAAAADLDLVLAGAAPPAADRHGTHRRVFAPRGSETAAKLVRLEGFGRRALAVVGRVVPHVGEHDAATGSDGPAVAIDPGLPTAGSWILSFDAPRRGVVRLPVFDLHDVLGDLPAVAGPPTVLFVLPYLAVGGAERLLFDLIRGLAGVRSVIVTLEPHRLELGQTVERARELTPHVYTLGDWLPREAHDGAVRHLLRRYEVRTMVCWNGTTWFYDAAPALARSFPDLRLVNQLYNHRGAWIEHYRPSLVRAVDCHVAVNRHIADALEARGVPAQRIRLIYHGVEVPELPSEQERRRRRDERRRELGLPLDALVVGTFVRIHRQKRPLDVVRLARRFRDRGVVFLLAGSGPLDGELDREIVADPPPNLVRLPMRRDPERLFDALDLCLLTSSFEGLPVFLLEGLARGIPCVATAVGDVPLLLAGGGGITVERPGDLEALEEAIEALLSEQRRRDEGQRGRRTVEERFGLDGYRRAYEEVLLPVSARQ